MTHAFLEAATLILMVTAPIFVYFVKLEKRLTKIETLLGLLVKDGLKCPLTSVKDSQ